ncbi:MAG: type I-E CRISPR-associated protein Cse1/CasA [Nitrospira sp.]|nr:type I-E CRISPR-associated protein Cse1/CasA [Nitrospira sp.]
MSQFNLIDEKWIPVRFFNGSREELGIQDTLLRAKEIAAIEDLSPLVVASLHRFLLAVLYRALEGPTDIDQAKKLFKEGLPGEKIRAYLEKWRDRFWLFHEKFPFYQVPDYGPKEKNGEKQWRSWSVLAAEHNADNAKVLFDHLDITKSGSVPSSRAACWILACQTFALGGGRSDFQYTKSSPSATAVMVLPLGRNLQDTLAFSLVPQNREVLKNDIPIWERTPEKVATLQKGTERAALGWADLYSWRTRSIKLHLQGNGETIGEIAFASGVGYSSENHADPMVGYRISEKKGKQYVRFRERGLWRDFDSLLPDNGNLAPKVIEHATALTKSNRDRFPRSVMVLGQANDQAKIEYWRMERFALPEALAGDRFIRTEIGQLLAEAEQAEWALEKAMKVAARFIIAKGERKLEQDKWNAGRWMPGDVSKFIGKSSFEAVPVLVANFWSTLESRFHETLSEYSVYRESENIRYEWLKSVRNALRQAWEQHRASVSMGDAWAIRALVKSEGPVFHKLKKLNHEIRKLEPQEEPV